MSKIKNDDLTRSGTAVLVWQ